MFAQLSLAKGQNGGVPIEYFTLHIKLNSQTMLRTLK